VLQEVRSEVNILQGQDVQIVPEANNIFNTNAKEMEAMGKWITDNPSQILAVKETNIGIQRSFIEMNSNIQNFNEVLDSIKSSLKEVPSRRELRQHAVAMDDEIV
jgi:hypothetical protein